MINDLTAMFVRQFIKPEVLSLTALAILSFAWIMINMPTHDDEVPLLIEEKVEALDDIESSSRDSYETEITKPDEMCADSVSHLAADDVSEALSQAESVRQPEDRGESSAPIEEDGVEDNVERIDDTKSSSEDDMEVDNDDDQKEADDEEDDTSSTSTDQYCEHEAWATYGAKVATFCQTLWPSLKPEEITIERMRGGSNNRIVGITLQPHQKLLPRVIRRLRSYAARQKPVTVAAAQYILRIPRFAEGRNLSEDTGLLEYVRGLGVPVPIVVKADYTAQNALEKPYLLQVRAPGKNLAYLWDDLNHKQRLCLAQQIAGILVKISSQRARVCGKVIGTESTSYIKTWEKSRMSPKIVLPSFMKFANKAATDLGRNFWQNPPRLMIPATLREWDYYKPYILPWDKLAQLTESMQAASGVFGPDDYWFCHGDFWPRNMLAEVTGPNTARITAILDWDLSSFAPAVIACNPPTWMWQWDEYCRHDSGRPEEEDLDKIAGDVPKDAESREFQKCFEEIVGKEFVRFAYHGDGHMARRLYPWVMEATMHCDDRMIAEDMLAEWQEKQDEGDDEVWCETQQ